MGIYTRRWGSKVVFCLFGAAYCFLTTSIFPLCAYSIPPDMVLISGGTFQMGDSFSEGAPDERPVHTVTLDLFYMGKYEVTNGQYCQYLNSALGSSIDVSGGVVYGSGNNQPYCDTSTSSSESQIVYGSGVFSVRTKEGRNMSNDPMICISWYGAVAYCNWRSQQEGKEQCYDLSTWNFDFSKHGYRLPTEAEWEYAARGGLSGKRFPWSDPNISHSQANYYSSSSYSYDISPTRGFHPAWNDGIYPYTSPVGSFAANGYGVYDMAGNVWQWCNDWYGSYNSSPQTNPTGPTSGSYRILRGAGWYSWAFDCRVAARFLNYVPVTRAVDLGFRVALVGEPPPTTVTIHGTVYNAASNTQIAGADVTANGTTVQTDSGGQYQIPDLPPGNIIVSVNKAGYVPVTLTQFCPTAGQSYQVNFYLYADVELIGLEVIQTIQNWQNDVPLIEGKKTYVRAHVKTKNNAPPVNIKAGLRVSKNGEEHNLIATCIATPNPQRFWTESLNFPLDENWCNGTLELTVIGEGIECSEAAGPITGDCSAEVSFTPTAVPKIVFLSISAPGAPGPNTNDLELLRKNLIDIYPIAKLDTHNIATSYYRFMPPSQSMLLDCMAIASIDSWMSDRQGWILCGVVNHNVTIGGKNLGSTAVSEYTSDIVAHEIGHCLGRPDAVSGILPCTIGKCGPCTENLWLAPEEDFPYMYVVDGQMRATIGPMDLGLDRLIYGLDVTVPEVKDPSMRFELMSYCLPRWISDHTYKKLQDEINKRFSLEGQEMKGMASTFLAQNTLAQDYLLVCGKIDVGTDLVDFLPFTYISNPVTPPQAPDPGDYILELLNDVGNTITMVPFEPARSSDGELAAFMIPVPADPNIKRALVTHDTNLIGSVMASNNPPTVQVLFPNGGEVFDGNQLSIEWIGNDLDDDNLTYVVNYSSDGGSTWDVLAVNWPEPNFTIERKFLTATNMGLIRVIASDGFNTATDESDSVFTVLNNAPEVVLFQPKTNAFFDANQIMFFEASALDREDGRLADSNLGWTSSIDGSLGTGSVLTRDSNSLSRGYHTITVTATDSGGLTASVSVNIWVRITPADLTDNNKVDFIDYAILANQWQLPPGIPSADIAPPPTGDGIVNLQDLALMAEYWLAGL